VHCVPIDLFPASSERLDDTHRRRVGNDHNSHTFFTSLQTFQTFTVGSPKP